MALWESEVSELDHVQNTDTGTTSTTFQIDSGNTGPKLKQDSGALVARNAADDADAPVKAATFKTGTYTLTVDETKSLSDKVDKITGSSLVADTEISKIHSQNTDTSLDLGGSNPVTAAELVTLRDTTVPAKADITDVNIADNRKAPAQAIVTTYAASGSSGIRVADDAELNMGTGDFTLVWEGSLPDWTPSGYTYIIDKTQNSENLLRIYLDTGSSGKLKIYLLGGNVGGVATSTVSLGISDNAIAQLAVCYDSVNNLVYFYVNREQIGAAVEVVCGTVTNTAYLQIAGYSTTQFAAQTQFAAIYNRALTAADVADLYVNGIAESDKVGSQTALTSGTLTVGKNYIIDTFETGDDFTNVGAASNADGVEFEATGTTPTTWTNGSSMRRIGATWAISAENAQPSPGQIFDITGHNNHALMPATGASLKMYKDTFQIKWVNTWAGTSETQYLGGFNQNILPSGYIRIDSITLTCTATGVNIEIGDGADADRFVTSTALATYLDCTIAARSHDLTNRKMTIKPGAAYTGTITTLVRGTIIE